MKQNLSSVVVLVSMLLAGNLFAQEQQVSSVLSNVGFGTTFSEASVAEKSQGDLSVVSNNNEEVLSFANPALLSDLQLTSFGVALQVLGSQVSSTDGNYNSASTSISNLYFGVPLGVKGGFSVGLRVRSAVGFEVSTDDFFNKGTGAVNQIYAGLGYEVYKGLSVGAQLSTYFGEITKQQATKSTQKSTVNDKIFNASGVATKIGIQYKLKVSETIMARLGAYGVLSHEIKADGSKSVYEALETTDNVFVVINPLTDNKISGIESNAFKSVYGAGLGERNKWFAGVSYESQGATTYTGDTFEYDIPVTFESSSKISLGGYIIPKKYTIKKYFEKVVYRAGLKYENTGIVLNNNSLKNLGMSFGLGLPVGKRISYANISVELGQLGDVAKNKYEEKYINIGVSFSLSDKWFKKRMID